MDSGAQNRRVLRESAAAWSEFMRRCISQRLETDRFQQFVPIVHAKNPLAPIFVADIFLKPQPSNDVSLDPRIPPYLQVLTQLGDVDAPSILQTLYKYSSLHALPLHPQPGDAANEDSKNGPQHKRLWRSSSWAEEVMFYHVIRTVVEGSAFRDTRAALVLVRIVCKWMNLFNSAFTAFPADVLGQVQNSQVRDEMDVARAAFVPLLLRLVETPALVKAISKPYAKGTTRQYWSFIHFSRNSV